MKIISVNKLLKRWNMDSYDLYNEILYNDIPVYVETPEYFTDKLPLYRADLESKSGSLLERADIWDLRWDRIPPELISVESIKDVSCPYIFKLDDIERLEAKRHEIEKNDFWGHIFKKGTHKNPDIEKASHKVEMICREIRILYENIKNKTSTDPDAQEHWKREALSKLSSDPERFHYIKKQFLEDEDLFIWYGSNPKRVFTGKLMVRALKYYNLLNAIGSSDYKKHAKLFLDVINYIDSS